VIVPPVEQVAVQLQGAEAPAASVPMFTLPHAVLVTTIPVTVTVPVLVTVPENVTPVPPWTQPFVHDWVKDRLVVLHEHVSVSAFELTVVLHGGPAVPVAWAVFVIGPPVEQVAVQLQGADAPAARVPMFTLPHAVLTTTTFVTGIDPGFVTVPENVTPVPPWTQPFVHDWVSWRLAVWQMHVSVSPPELTLVLHGAPALPLAVAVFEIVPPVEQAAVQLHGAEAPAARLPMFTLPQAVFVTTTPVSATLPVFVTVPEKVIPVPPWTQPFEQI
jgi:hypothetical protein